MGLLFVMPVDESEVDRISISDKQITLKSYGLPLIFWGYLLASLSVVGCMYLAIQEPLQKLYMAQDTINQALAIIVFLTLILTPAIFITIFFYEKSIVKKGLLLTVIHKIFWIPIWRKTIHLAKSDYINVAHYLDSPNMARIHGQKEMKAFENRGYFVMFVINEDGKKIEIDRHSRKSDLIKIKSLLESY